MVLLITIIRLLMTNYINYDIPILLKYFLIIRQLFQVGRNIQFSICISMKYLE